MKKVYHLASCSTCARIISETGLAEKGFVLQNIKAEKITPSELDEMKKMAGSYEALFSRRSQLYKAMGLKDKTLNEQDYRRLILGEYTFLKRPVVINGRDIFVGNDTKTVDSLREISGKQQH